MKNNSLNLSTQDKNACEAIQLSMQRAEELEAQFLESQLPEGFFFEGDNLMYQEKSNNSQSSPIFICSRLDVTAYTRDDANQNHGRLLEFKDIDQFHHTWAMPMELLAADGTRYREELLSRGLLLGIDPKARKLLTLYIQSSKPLARIRCVNRTGWHKSSFILPNETIGLAHEEKIILQTTSSHLPDYSVAGSLQDWQTGISKLCRGNSRLIFSLSVAFASPLLTLLGLENRGFHFRGASSTGKTTALHVAASAWGGKDYIQRWRATTNGLEALSATHNDTLLCLDELSQVDPYQAGENAYMLANGCGKVRSDRHCLARKKATWNLIFLSTGEISLASHMEEAGKKVRAGQEVRIIDIPADIHAYGLFEDLHGYENGAAFSQVLNQACNKYHGTAAREFLRCLIEKRASTISVIQTFMSEFLKAHVPKEADGQVYRAATHFALVAAAGELAIAFGITGWNRAEAMQATSQCFKDWLHSRRGLVCQEEMAILSQVRRFFEQHGEGRFTSWDLSSEPQPRTLNRAGFRRLSQNGEMEYFVLPETFKTDIAKGFDPKLVAKVCLKHGLLRLGSKDELTRSEQFPGWEKKVRCYRFIHQLLKEEECND